jgi:hypothetical protein
MMKRSSSRSTPDDARVELEALFDDIDEIEKLLEPLQGEQAASLRSQLEDKRKKLELVDDEESSSFKLSLLRKEVRKLRTKAEALADDSFVTSTSLLVNQIDEVGKTLQPMQDPDSQALQSQLEDKKKKLASVSKKELPGLQKEILALKEQADTLSTKSFLLNEIDRIDKILGSAKSRPFIRRSELEALEEEKKDQRKRLQSADENELASLRKTINKLKEDVDAFVTREGWRARLGRISAIAWLLIIPCLILFYSGWVASWQWRVQPTIQTFQMQTATAQTATAAGMQTETAAVMQTATAQALPPTTETPTP